ACERNVAAGPGEGAANEALLAARSRRGRRRRRWRPLDEPGPLTVAAAAGPGPTWPQGSPSSYGMTEVLVQEIGHGVPSPPAAQVKELNAVLFKLQGGVQEAKHGVGFQGMLHAMCRAVLSERRE
ncbi:unnamed protein product, partial [Prorocentrum cordatum]